MPQDEPLALVAAGPHGLTITAATEAAAAGGVHPGMALADARALLPGLRARPAEPAADRRAIVRLARWCGRYGPSRNIDLRPPAGSAPGTLLVDHGLWIETTGVAGLFGGEAALLDDLARRLADFGLSARLGLADTLGAAHALARFGTPVSRRSGDRSRRTGSWVAAAAGRTAEILAPLPVEALRLASPDIVALKRLGLRRIGDLYDLPRATLERRFHDAAGNSGALTRLDQALGRAPEPLRPLREVPELVVRQAFPSPLVSAEGLEAEVRRLIDRLCAMLEARELGLRRIRVALYRTDGTMADMTVGTSTPVRHSSRIMALLADRLSALDAGLGIDMLTAEVPAAERFIPTAVPLAARLAGTIGADPGELIDRLANHLGAGRVTVLAPCQSHIPERTEARYPALYGGEDDAGWPAAAAPSARRPPILLQRPEPITVTAEVPDGAPVVFTWRRITRRVARAEGPERIAPEWWRSLPAPPGPPATPAPDARGTLQPRPDAPRTRDYYRIEDSDGGAYWVFRNGRHGDQAGDAGDAAEGPPGSSTGPPANSSPTNWPPVWFLHGLFA